LAYYDGHSIIVLFGLRYSKKMKAKKNSLLAPTFKVTLLSMLNMAVTFITQIIISYHFGASAERDAYFVVTAIPIYVSSILSSSLSVTFIPIFVENETNKNETEAWKIASIFMNFIFLALSGLSIIGIIFARQIIALITPGFSGEMQVLTSSLLRIMMPTIVLNGLSNLLSSIYYAEYRYVQPGLSTIINSAVMLISVVLMRSLGVYSLAIGFLLGSFANFLILTPIVFTSGKYIFSFDIRHPAVKRIIQVMSPLIFFGAFYNSVKLLEKYFASSLSVGSISYLGYGNKIILVLNSLAINGISVTIFPLMARSWAVNDMAGVRKYFAKGVRGILLIAMPISAIFIALGVPIIQFLFERGSFDHATTVAVANVLSILMVTFVSAGLGNVVGKGFYIAQETNKRAMLGIFLIGVYYVLAWVFSKQFSYIGLAVATSLHSIIGLAITTAIMRRLYGGINGMEILNGFLKITISSFLSGIVMYISYFFNGFIDIIAVKLMISVILGGIVYYIMIFRIFRLPEVQGINGAIIDFMKKKLGLKKLEK